MQHFYIIDVLLNKNDWVPYEPCACEFWFSKHSVLNSMIFNVQLELLCRNDNWFGPISSIATWGGYLGKQKSH